MCYYSNVGNLSGGNHKKVGAWLMMGNVINARQYKEAVLFLKEKLSVLQEAEELVRMKVCASHFMLCPSELIDQINDTVIFKLPHSKKTKQQEARIKHIRKHWTTHQLLLKLKQLCEVEAIDDDKVTTLQPKKVHTRNHEADKRDQILYYKEQLIQLLKLFTEGFNELVAEERQVLYHCYFENLSELKTMKLMNLSRSTIQRIKKKATINLKENFEIALFMKKGAFRYAKSRVEKII